MKSAWRWLTRQLRRTPANPPERRREPVIREFVYLDEVSVSSLLASRQGSIPSEFTSRNVEALRDEVEAEVGASARIASARLKSTSSASTERTSQVVRRAIVQSAFKELYELEAERLLLRPQDEGTVNSENGDAPAETIAVDRLRRGDLVELEVELETHAMFRINAVFSAFLEIAQEDIAVFGGVAEETVSQIRTFNRLLDKLLTGLVPIRARVLDWRVTDDQPPRLVRTNDIGTPSGIDGTLPLYLVGLVEQRLFWKDIRRLLFSKAHFRVYARIAKPGVQMAWTPVKLADVIGIVAPQFEGQMLEAVNESTLAAISTGAGDQASPSSGALFIARRFLELLESHHGASLTAERRQEIANIAVARQPTVESIDEQRRMFSTLTELADIALGVTTDPDTAVDLRGEATAARAEAPQEPPPSPTNTRERYLDTEIVAIYW